MSIPKMSVCVVAKNAAATTKPLFDSLKEFADRRGDMVLVDTGSNDNTPAIYRAFGFRVFEVGDKFRITIPDEAMDAINKPALDAGEPPIVNKGDTLFDFGSARNFAAEQALNDFIINPDADEAMTVFDIDKVQAEFEGGNTRMAYDFVFDHNPDGTPHLQFVTDTRLSDRRYWVWKGHVHETNQPRVPGTNPVMKYVPPSVLKIEHWQIPSTTRGSYLPGLAYACYLEPENDRNLHYYGRELMYRGWPHASNEALARHIKLSRWDMERGQSMVFMGDNFVALKRPDLALEAYHNATLTDPLRREGWLRAAGLYYNRGDAARTAQYAMAAIGIPKSPGFYGDIPENYKAYPHHLLYWAFWNLGDKAKSYEHWLTCLAMEPTNPTFVAAAQFYKDVPK